MGLPLRFPFFAATLALLLLPAAWAGTLQDTCAPRFAHLDSRLNILAPERLASEIAERRGRVPEFRFIREEARRRGLRVWLFGGTAAGYSHYVKWDVLRETGDLRFQPQRFDYDYTNIYRSTQDLDIVVDGNAQQASEFEQALKEQFPYFLGSKAAAWEVRSLKEARGDKGAILDDFGFMNQHTDSNSTGMVELTDPPKGESVVRDIRDWKNAEAPAFLRDVAEGKLTFYHSPTHDRTPRAKAGKNPPIFAVVRALTKAFQYDLAIRDEDLTVLKKEIEEFDPKRDLANPEAAYWLEKNGKKLFQHAVNLEEAWNTLEKLGLRRKLISIKGDSSKEGSLAWWMSKEPLRSEAVGQGHGRTAASLGIRVVAHSTIDFPAYESITRSHTGSPNVFESRKATVGEGAAYGQGFYTAQGTKGAKGGITIRFDVDPNAREGHDFIIGYGVNVDQGKPGEGSYIVWKNKNAIRVIPESLDLNPVEYFELLAQGEGIKAEDEALRWKLKRQLSHSVSTGALPRADLLKIRDIVREQIKSQSPNRDLVVREWLELTGIPADLDLTPLESFEAYVVAGDLRVRLLLQDKVQRRLASKRLEPTEIAGIRDVLRSHLDDPYRIMPLWLKIKNLPPEADFSPSDYFQAFAHVHDVIDEERKAVFKAVQSRLAKSISGGRVSSEEIEKIRATMRTEFDRPQLAVSDTLASEWLKIEAIRSERDPRSAEALREVAREILGSQLEKEKSANLHPAMRLWARIESARAHDGPGNLDQALEAFESGTYKADPAPFFSTVLKLSHQTSLEPLLTKELHSLKPDLGDRALENCLLADSPEIRALGERALHEREARGPTPFTEAMIKLQKTRDPKSWISAETSSLDAKEKAAYLALHPELRNLLNPSGRDLVESELKKASNYSVFEELAKGHLPANARSESFEFVSFEFPAGGKRVKHGRPGSWQMQDDEHEVTLTKPYAIQVTPVTELQWSLVMGELPSSKGTGGKLVESNLNRPVENVDSYQAAEFATRLSQADPDYDYRLPTDAEWEYAARAGTTSEFSFGDQRESTSYAWSAANAKGHSHEVASLKPNGNGLYDVHGNVSEWVADSWISQRPSHAVDPVHIASTQRVTRGGAYHHLGDIQGTAYRFQRRPFESYEGVGLRLVRVPKKPK